MRGAHYRELGLGARRDVVLLTQNYFLQNDANNLLAMADTWLNGDISANPVFNGDFKRALKAIRCRACVMPGATDLYFRVADSEAEIKLMPHAACHAIPTDGLSALPHSELEEYRAPAVASNEPNVHESRAKTSAT